jgi:hypothetical protein
MKKNHMFIIFLIELNIPQQKIFNCNKIMDIHQMRKIKNKKKLSCNLEKEI